MIRAEVHTDDRVFEVKFDATKYFEEAPAKAIVDLAQIGWGGDYPADWVAEFMADTNPEIERLFNYLNLPHVRGRWDSPGFECHVNQEDAIEWLKRHRRDVAAKVIKSAGPREWLPEKPKKRKKK